jgi:hypothetical protein
VNPERYAQLKEIVLTAASLDESARGSYLDGACAGDSTLRAEAEELLASLGGTEEAIRTGAFDEALARALGGARPTPASGVSAGDDSSSASTATLAEAIGASKVLGPYRLLQKIGEGGMGEVWLSEQIAPIRRKVALKLIKSGMDTRQFVARFEAERQALALMDHPSIAKIFDAGATPQGLPYFVMEYVQGEPITVYCDRQRLPIRERLDLLSWVCEAVQHAHQKGVIHRDLKPSNILVTIQGERPVPKIIDFGVARATAHRLTERTLFTELGVLIGTPEYMSPEQAELTGLDVDTRTDVYALAPDPRSRPAAAEHQGEEPGGCLGRVRAQAPHRAREARQPPSRRSRLDHDEGARKGPDATLRLRGGSGRGSQALPGR